MSINSEVAQRWRRRFGLPAAMVLIAAMAIFGAVPSSATHQDVFELDGNIVDAGGSVAPWDWSKFFSATGARLTPLPTGFEDSGFDDDYQFPDLSTYTGGSKDTLDVSGWSCTNSNNLGGKFDILNAYSTIYEVPSSTATYNAGDLLLFFGIERAATEGDGNMGFWFLKDSSVDCEKTGGGKAPAFSGNHVDGDIFVVVGFSNGGTQATVQAYYWVGGANGSLATTPFIDEDTALCVAGAPHDACGIVNTSEITPPWPAPDKNEGALDVNAFYEGFVRVPAANVSGCFATFVANTRSSTSPTSTIHDFSRGSFPTCAPSTDLGASASATGSSTTPPQIYSGGSATFTFTEVNDGNVSLTNPNVTADNGCSPTGVKQPDDAGTPGVDESLFNLGDLNENSKLDPGETWTFRCTVTSITADLTVTGIGHGTDPLGRDVTTVASGTCASNDTRFCDADEIASAIVDVIAPSTTMTTTAATATPDPVHANENVTFTFYEKNDGDVILGTPTVEADNGCSPTEVKQGSPDNAYNAGDVNDNGVFDIGETWVFSCTTSFASAGTGTVTAIGHATDPLGNDITFWAGCTAGAVVSGDRCDLQETTSKSVTVINPNISLVKTASALVTYTFVLANDGDAEMTSPSVTDDKCTTAQVRNTVNDPNTTVDDTLYNIGDDDFDNKLDDTEEWTFSCTQTITGATANQPITNTGTGSAVDAAGSTVTYCVTPPNSTTLCDPDARDQASVEVKHL